MILSPQSPANTDRGTQTRRRQQTAIQSLIGAQLRLSTTRVPKTPKLPTTKSVVDLGAKRKTRTNNQVASQPAPLLHRQKQRRINLPFHIDPNSHSPRGIQILTHKISHRISQGQQAHRLRGRERHGLVVDGVEPRDAAGPDPLLDVRGSKFVRVTLDAADGTEVAGRDVDVHVVVEFV